MRYLWLLLPALLLGYGLTGVAQVRPGERAVVRRFGRVLPHKPEPGLWVGLPWGMDRIDRVSVDKIQSVGVGYQEEAADAAIPAGQLLTGDHNLVNLQATLYYKVRPGQVEDYVVHADRVEELIARAAETVLAEWVAARTVDDVLLNAKTALPPDLTAGTRRRLEPYRLGIDVLDSRVALAAPPEQVKAAFDRVARAQTEAATRVNQAEQEARAKRRDAEAYTRRLELQARTYEERVLGFARAEAGGFRARLAEYQRAKVENPNYLRQIWDEEVGELMKKLQDNRQLAPLDHLLHALGLDLHTMPAVPGRKP